MNALTDHAIAAAFLDEYGALETDWAFVAGLTPVAAIQAFHRRVLATAARYAERPGHDPDCPCEDCDIAASTR